MEYDIRLKRMHAQRECKLYKIIVSKFDWNIKNLYAIIQDFKTKKSNIEGGI